MPSVDKNLTTALGLKPVLPSDTAIEIREKVEVISGVVETTRKRLDELKDQDMMYVRGIYRQLIDKAMEEMSSAYKLAEETESPRAMEVANNMIKIIAEIASMLVQAHKDSPSSSNDQPKQVQTGGVTHNTVVLTTTADLATMFENINKSKLV